MLRSFEEVFAAFNGPAEVGRAIGVTTEHACSMRRRGSIPSDYWASLEHAAAERGRHDINTHTLSELRAKLRAERRMTSAKRAGERAVIHSGDSHGSPRQ